LEFLHFAPTARQLRHRRPNGVLKHTSELPPPQHEDSASHRSLNAGQVFDLGGFVKDTLGFKDGEAEGLELGCSEGHSFEGVVGDSVGDVGRILVVGCSVVVGDSDGTSKTLKCLPGYRDFRSWQSSVPSPTI